MNYFVLPFPYLESNRKSAAMYNSHISYLSSIRQVLIVAFQHQTSNIRIQYLEKFLLPIFLEYFEIVEEAIL